MMVINNTLHFDWTHRYLRISASRIAFYNSEIVDTLVHISLLFHSIYIPTTLFYCLPCTVPFLFQKELFWAQGLVQMSMVPNCSHFHQLLYCKIMKMSIISRFHQFLHRKFSTKTYISETESLILNCLDEHGVKLYPLASTIVLQNRE